MALCGELTQYFCTCFHMKMLYLFSLLFPIIKKQSTTKPTYFEHNGPAQLLKVKITFDQPKYYRQLCGMRSTEEHFLTVWTWWDMPKCLLSLHIFSLIYFGLLSSVDIQLEHCVCCDWYSAVKKTVVIERLRLSSLEERQHQSFQQVLQNVICLSIA